MGFGQSGSKPLAKEDLQRPDGTYGRATVVIDRLTSKQFDDEDDATWFLWMVGKPKPIRLNKTNTDVLVSNFGIPDDIDSQDSVSAKYAGAHIVVYVDPTVEFPTGVMVGGIKIHGPDEVPLYKNPNKVDENGQIKSRSSNSAGGGFVDDEGASDGAASEEPPAAESNAFEGADDGIPF